MSVTAICTCGAEFKTTEKRRAVGRGKYCSKACAYSNMQRPSGLKYEIKAVNRAWFKPGHDVPSGAQNPAWRGEEVTYQRLHRWVRQHKTLPAACEHCGCEEQLEWANKSRNYRRDLSDWLALCRLCHRRYDSGPWRGAATAKYGQAGIRGLRG